MARPSGRRQGADAPPPRYATANLPFLSKVIEKAIAIQIYKHLSKTGIIDEFQSAYKAGHSCETARLRVFNDIASTIGKGNGNLLVLLDLSAALIPLIMLICLLF